jgi:hypothetical protein
MVDGERLDDLRERLCFVHGRIHNSVCVFGRSISDFHFWMLQPTWPGGKRLGRAYPSED